MRKVIMSCVVFLSLGLAFGIANADIDEGLVAHWKFDESSGTDASDSSGNGYDGTLVNMGDSNWVEGKVGNALDFDGTDTYVEVGDVGEYSDISITLWVNIDSLPVEFNSIFHHNLWSSGDVHFMIRASGVVQFSVNATSPTDQQSDYVFSDTDFGTWKHIGAVYDMTAQSVTFYIDGQQDSVVSYTTVRTAVPGPMQIGNWNDAVRNFDGRMDDLRIYGRALSADDALELYEWVGGANAGKDQRVEAGETVTLSGSGP
ncbi:LamG domain-containing protein, partial [bacterium]|nr:LamG domain-containing protein [bacterium]